MRFLTTFLCLILPLSSLELKGEKGALKKSVRDFLTFFEVPSALPERSLYCYLQKEWFQPGKERWEMKETFEEKRESALPFLIELGCINPVYAQKTHYNYALVLGALGKTMQRRLDFLYEEWERGVRFDQIILLTGDRELNGQIETFPEGLKSETELFIHLFNQHPLKRIAGCQVIASPKHLLCNGESRRPNTKNTICDWLATGPKPGSCLMVSTQPFIGYQESVCKFILPSCFEVEGVGPGTKNVYPTAEFDMIHSNTPYPLAIYLDNFVKWLLYEQLRDQ